MTNAEHRLWHRLRAHRFQNLKFKRQAPIGPYVVDFICFDHKLVVEVDGGQHSENTADNKRDAWLRSEGYCVLRFWNHHDVLKNTNAVLERIANTLESADTPLPARGARHRAGASAPDPLARHPLPQGERESNPRDRE